MLVHPVWSLRVIILLLLRSLAVSTFLPTAYAVGCILSPLRGWDAGIHLCIRVAAMSQISGLGLDDCFDDLFG
jgi:hypothetical protein